MSDVPDDLAAIRAELARRGALPERPVATPRPVVVERGHVTEYQGSDNAYLVILAEAVNRLAQSIVEMRTQAQPGPRVRRIERDELGNIIRIVEE